jgi:pimeloyl-ACP methyl ester carboxylesterase
MGLSIGAWMSCLYALHYPGRLGKAVLLSSPGVFRLSPTFIWHILLSAISPGLHKRFVAWLSQDSVCKDAATRSFVEQQMRDGYLALRILLPKKVVYPRVFKDEELRSLQVPMLALFGENEKICSARRALQRLNRVSPQMKAEIIPGAGHDLASQAELVSRKAVEFLKS